MVFSKNWLRNHLKFLLHFLIHIDVLTLCRKFELFLTNIFQVMRILNCSKIWPSIGYTCTCNVFVHIVAIGISSECLFN